MFIILLSLQCFCLHVKHAFYLVIFILFFIQNLERKCIEEIWVVYIVHFSMELCLFLYIAVSIHMKSVHFIKIYIYIYVLMLYLFVTFHFLIWSAIVYLCWVFILHRNFILIAEIVTHNFTISVNAFLCFDNMSGHC